MKHPAGPLFPLAIEPRLRAGDFSWDLIPEGVCVSVVQELTGSTKAPVEARAYLAERHPLPDDDFLRRGQYSCDVAHVIRKQWPRLNPLVLEHLYGLAESFGLLPVTKRQPSSATMHKRLGALRLQVNFRRAILETLLRFGSRTGSSEALQDLPSFFVVASDSAAEPGELFPYQLQAIKRLRTRFAKDGFNMRGLVVMPTGSGKTRTAVAWLLDDVVAKGHKVLWVTHRTELMEQTARAFVAAAPRLARRVRARLAVRLVGGGYGPGTTIASPMHDVAIASVATLARNTKALRTWLNAHEVVIVFDEAHH